MGDEPSVTPLSPSTPLSPPRLYRELDDVERAAGAAGAEAAAAADAARRPHRRAARALPDLSLLSGSRDRKMKMKEDHSPPRQRPKVPSPPSLRPTNAPPSRTSAGGCGGLGCETPNRHSIFGDFP
jgi:hypothetical protein